eukprot:TRINITY_DN5393_c0_g2_i2.p2 TRINITY_DN5393_c0_g2~~TRINITY_DN5393_c0_g2_i2.p2  ORF type:complete len:145 (-),score=29.62 TRINITY_DN5393_c0_g2_i2:779-1213(-)
MSEAYEPRLKTRYKNEIKKSLREQFSYTNEMQIPRLDKIVINMGVGEATADSKKLTSAIAALTAISGQKPVATKARKSIAAFKLREGMSVGAKVTLRQDPMYSACGINAEYMGSWRSVTFAPTLMPSRSLNAAIDLRAFVATGF